MWKLAAVALAAAAIAAAPPAAAAPNPNGSGNANGNAGGIGVAESTGGAPQVVLSTLFYGGVANAHADRGLSTAQGHLP